MSVHDDALRIYSHLVQVVIPQKKVTTYGEIPRDTGVPMGPEGKYLTQVLYHLFKLCDEAKVPPITVVVVQADTAYDSDRHGSVGAGYLRAEAGSVNESGRTHTPAFAAAVTSKRRIDSDTAPMEFRDMIELHQDAVWERANWPSLD